MLDHTIESWSIDHLLDDLDKSAQHSDDDSDLSSEWLTQRRHERHPFRVGCTVRYLASGGDCVASLPGRTRNLSRGGIGFLVRRVFAPGEVAEVEIVSPTKTSSFMAGLVRFCRYAGQSHYEVGIEFREVAPQTILTNDPRIARQRAVAFQEKDKQDPDPYE